MFPGACGCSLGSAKGGVEGPKQHVAHKLGGLDFPPGS